MTQHKDFDAARAEATGEAISFTLGGEEFTVLQPIPILPVLDLAAVDESESEQGTVKAFRDMIFSLLSEEDAPRFRQACQKSRADAETLGAISQWVIQAATQTPLVPASDLPESESITSDTLSTVSEHAVSTSSG